MSLKVITNITLNLQTPNYATVYAAQSDSLSRYISATLLDGSAAWLIPQDAMMTIRFRKPDGTVGFYDTDENGDIAYSFHGSAVEFVLAQQALAAPGDVLISLDFYTAAGEQLSTFTWKLIVPASPYSDSAIISSDYFNVLTATIALAKQYADLVKASYGAPLAASTASAMEDTGRIYVYIGSETGYTFGDWYYWNGTAWTRGGVYNSTAFETDTTLSVAGMAADAKTVGDTLAAMVIVDLRTTYHPASAPDQFFLDLNGNGLIDNTDQVRFAQIVGGATPTAAELTAIDLYGDGEFSARDSQECQRLMSQIIGSAYTMVVAKHSITYDGGSTVVKFSCVEQNTKMVRADKTQNFTDTEKQTVLTNIGAAAEEEVNELIADLGNIVYSYDTPADVAMEQGAIGTTGGNSNSTAMLAGRRRTAGYVEVNQKSSLSCDSAYTMCIFYYSGKTASTYMRNTDYIGSSYKVPAVDGAKWIRIVIKRADGEKFADEEIPTITYLKATDKITALDAELEGLQMSAEQAREYSSTDLNDYIEVGYVNLGYSGIFTNTPNGSIGQRIVFTYFYGGVRWQIYLNLTTREMYARVYADSAWKGWQNFIPAGLSETIFAFSEHLSSLETAAQQARTYTSTDLDDFTEIGYMVLPYSGTYSNAPNENTGYRIVLTFVTGGVRHQYWLNITRKEYFVRVYANKSWLSWTNLQPEQETAEQTIYNESKNASIYDPSYTQSAFAGDLSTDDRVRVLSYNVAQYDNDGAVHIGDSGKEETLIHFKQMLMEVGADIVCTQEDAQYIDSGDTLSPLACLFSPLYPYKVGVGGPAMYYRKAGTVKNYSLTGVTVRRGIVQVGTKSLYVYTAHLNVNSPETRQAQLQTILSDAIGVDNPEYWVLCGDFNTIEEADRTFLTDFAAKNGCTLANGGYLGWLNTNKVNLPLDNFLCGPKVVITKFEVLGNWYGSLWSDHYPVYVDVALCD